MDRNLRFQQNLQQHTLGIVLVRARSNRLVDIAPIVPAIADAITLVALGELIEVGT